MEKLFDYLLYLAETITTVIAIIVILGFFISKAAESKLKEKGQITLKRLNEHYKNTKKQFEKELLDKAEYKQKNAKKDKKKKTKLKHPTLFVIDFKGDIQASAVESLREEVTAIILGAQKQDEVCIRIESPGGMVPHYGLAASQLLRLKQANIKLTVCVDKVAASGGYMMAAVADRIIAAPFAIIGSIGVVAQIPNFHRFLDKNSVDFEQITAGTYKRTLTMFGKNTNEAREKVQDEVNLTHDLFKQHIVDNRPQIDIEQVATGEHWFAIQTLDKALVDEIQTSDDYLMSKLEQRHILHIKYDIKPSKIKQLTGQAAEFIMQSFPIRSVMKKIGW